MGFLRYVGTNLILLLAIAADVITIGVLIRKPNWIPQDDHIWVIYYSNLLISVLTIFLLIRVSYLEYKWRRKKRYALAFKFINQGFAEVHELERSHEPASVTKLNSLEKFCDALAQTFRHITTAECNVCIKILSKQIDRLEVWTLVRDSVSKNSRPLQQKDTAKNLHHWVDSNTDFSSIIRNMEVEQKRYFCCNNLLWLNDYKNTRMPDSGKRFSKNFILNQIHKIGTWPLPYRSCLVVPIIPGYFNSSSSELLTGFLCIDSPEIYIFKEKYDLPIAQGVADGLYNILVRYYDLLKYNVP